MGSQAWVTGTDPHLFDAFGDRAQSFDVRASTETSSEAAAAPRQFSMADEIADTLCSSGWL